MASVAFAYFFLVHGGIASTCNGGGDSCAVPEGDDLVMAQARAHRRDDARSRVTRRISLTFPMTTDPSSLIALDSATQRHSNTSFCVLTEGQEIQKPTVDADGEKHLSVFNATYADGKVGQMSFMEMGEGKFSDVGVVCCKGMAPSEEPIVTSCAPFAPALYQIPETIVDVKIKNNHEEGDSEALQQIARFSRKTQGNILLMFEHQNVLDKVGLLEHQNVQGGVAMRVGTNRVVCLGWCVGIAFTFFMAGVIGSGYYSR